MSLQQLPTNLYEAFAQVGKALSNPHRLRILNLLSQCDLAVDELASALDQSKANTSAHLKVLRQSKMVDRRRDGKRVYYRIAGDQAAAVWMVLRDMGLRELPRARELMRRHRQDDKADFSLLDSAELREKIATGEVMLLDLRPAREFAAGHLPHAQSIPLTELEDRLDELPLNKSIVAYCRGPYCVGAITSVELLRNAGRDAYILRESVLEWRAHQLELETTEVPA